jgi:TolB-like protein
MVRHLDRLASAFLLLGIAAGARAQQATTSVAVCNFRALKSDATTDWIGAGIQQAISADLAKATSIALRDIAKDVTDPDQATAIIRRDSIDVVVVGQFQVAGDEVRATGKILSAGGKQVAFLSSKGSLKEIFRLQDDLAKQAHDALVHDVGGAGGTGAGTQPANGGAPSIPFAGSLLERALADEAAGRRPADGTNRRAGNTAPPSYESPGGWGGGGTGVGITGGYNPYSPYVPYYPGTSVPPRSGSGTGSGGSGGGGAGGGGSGSGSGTGSGKGSAPPQGGTPPAAPPSNPPGVVNPFSPNAPSNPTPGNSPSNPPSNPPGNNSK